MLCLKATGARQWALYLAAFPSSGVVLTCLGPDTSVQVLACRFERCDVGEQATFPQATSAPTCTSSAWSSTSSPRVAEKGPQTPKLLCIPLRTLHKSPKAPESLKACLDLQGREGFLSFSNSENEDTLVMITCLVGLWLTPHWICASGK